MVLLLNTTTKPEPELTGTSGTGSVLKKDQKAQKVKKMNDFIS